MTVSMMAPPRNMGDVVQLVGAYAVGAALGVIAWRSCRGIFESAVFGRENYRGQTVFTSVGVLVSLVVVFAVGCQAAIGQLVSELSSADASLGSSNAWDQMSFYGPSVALLALAFSFLGMLDDVAGVGESGGFSGHFKALFAGRVTTGLVKMIGGPVVAVVVLSALGTYESLLGLLRDAAVVSLAANLANLFDRAPGRTNKVAQLMFLVLVVASTNTRLAPVAVALGGAVALLGPDLREEMMIGDAGSNAIGALLGIGAVFVSSGVQLWFILAVLFALNVGSEFVSYSKVIDSVAPLRKLDRLGAPHRPR